MVCSPCSATKLFPYSNTEVEKARTCTSCDVMFSWMALDLNPMHSSIRLFADANRAMKWVKLHTPQFSMTRQRSMEGLQHQHPMSRSSRSPWLPSFEQQPRSPFGPLEAIGDCRQSTTTPQRSNEHPLSSGNKLSCLKVVVADVTIQGRVIVFAESGEAVNTI